MFLGPSASFSSYCCGFPSYCDQHGQEYLRSFFCTSISMLVRGEDGLALGVQMSRWDNFFNCSHLNDPSGVRYEHNMAWWGLFALKCSSFPFTSLLAKSTYKYFSVIFTRVILVSVMANLADIFPEHDFPLTSNWVSILPLSQYSALKVIGFSFTSGSAILIP